MLIRKIVWKRELFVFTEKFIKYSAFEFDALVPHGR